MGVRFHLSRITRYPRGDVNVAIRIRFGLWTFLAAAVLLSVVFGLTVVLYRMAHRPQWLISASYEGDVNKVRHLLKEGTNPNVRDAWDTSPMMIAAGWGQLEIVKTLLDAGVPINERSRFNRTPLMWAAASGQMDMVQLLLKAGADPSLMDVKGKTASDLAIDNGHDDIAELINTRMP